MTKAELIKRVRLNAEPAQVVDGLWFLEAERPFGYEKALQMDTIGENNERNYDGNNVMATL
jgi:hypothetical protein